MASASGRGWARSANAVDEAKPAVSTRGRGRGPIHGGNEVQGNTLTPPSKALTILDPMDRLDGRTGRQIRPPNGEKVHRNGHASVHR
jgi:hypothetical protein